ncbi:ABC transporter ATP-binding protein [uncultured Brevundimonas sp.]|uniref:ABC transporter ATP-binding protein n=1 Tax=uncultured Brevundimonas sp. TaxID=213418 RepID=UPI0025F455A6|nr:ABC transporter ATP-binding protein [uncultured Brevundimonas sp.]
MKALALELATARLGNRAVLEAVSLTVRAGELVALVGPNGAGKSSAIRALAGLLPLSAGRALLGDTPVDSLSSRARAAAAAYLPQERRIAWNMPAAEVAALGAPFQSSAEALSSAHAALKAVEADHLADRGVAEMSGGERARVLLARAVAAQSQALLVDEPLAGLDPDAQLMVLNLLRTRARAGQAVLVSLHDLGLAARYADRVVVMDQGRVVADAAPTEALTPQIMAEVFSLSARWIDGPEGSLLSQSRYSDGSSVGVNSPAPT